jgi:hypothetical protein
MQTVMQFTDVTVRRGNITSLLEEINVLPLAPSTLATNFTDSVTMIGSSPSSQDSLRSVKFSLPTPATKPRHAMASSSSGRGIIKRKIAGRVQRSRHTPARFR